MSVVAVLLAILVPALGAARSSARRTACMSNLRQVGIAIHAYAGDYDNSIPIGPKAPPFLSPSDFYPSTGAPTSLISLSTGAPVAMGLLLHSHLSQQRKVLFCPDADQRVCADDELANVGTRQAQCSYYYRHASATRLFDNPSEPTVIRIPLSNLGRNRNGRPARALAVDTQFLCPEDLAQFNVRPRTHHRLKFANVLFSDGGVTSCRNTDGRFTVDLLDYNQVRKAFDNILQVLENADEER
ncbi:MAG TPA: DUF1559 domain-containing protein [Sedimentisphaerales bacterium]|nr:DUF1559 domain-containing protein [Sedimentisphaerales bacterium]HOC63837.1 DUF1559 domain-containing protein [Sedimentisphaerales bacterium]HOH64487.1 DUF1559 domain-containing protein [Sedimentisphaerales bacterium]HPY51030.1 DUF1559 domain-containing protein [Sedimentisphaerales bacterium]HQA88728.1 DUF1559 domain-containing protein [Sedimentisphaerales bacterium]